MPEWPIVEPIQVALAAIYRCNSRWLEELAFRQRKIRTLVDEDYGDRLPDSHARGEVARKLQASLDRFNAEFPETPLFMNESTDRRHIAAFYAVMAAEFPGRPGDAR
jgi:hypothetical protein